ncbi:MAG: hypothetical protein AAF405_05395, partial [Pseudomonadota bacterium]
AEPMRWLLLAIVPLMLAGCVTEPGPALPMMLSPADTAQTACLTYDDTPTFGECGRPTGEPNK